KNVSAGATGSLRSLTRCWFVPGGSGSSSVCDCLPLKTGASGGPTNFHGPCGVPRDGIASSNQTISTGCVVAGGGADLRNATAASFSLSVGGRLNADQ